jgi:hypothetical protein
MAMKPLSKAVAFAAMAISGAAIADTPTLKEVLGVSDIAVSGYIDASYNYYDVDPADQPGTLLNYFDQDKSSFNLKQASITVASQPKEGFGGLVNLTLGNDAKYIHSYGAGSSDSDFDVTQAFFQYATGPFTIIGGKFNTLAGAEVIAPTGNSNISRSIAFLQALPFTHTGLRASYMPIDSLTLYAGINNGWDQQQDINSDKTGELGLIWNANDMFTLAASLYSGKETICDPTGAFDPDGTCLDEQDKNRFLFDTVLTFKPTEGLALILNYDYGKQEDAILDTNGKTDDAEWEAIVGYINYQFNDLWRISIRGEQYNDKDGWKVGLVDQDIDSNTFGELSDKTTSYAVTVGYAPADNFELRGEVRQDFTDKDALIDGDKATDNQTFVALEGLYKF